MGESHLGGGGPDGGGKPHPLVSFGEAHEPEGEGWNRYA